MVSPDHRLPKALLVGRNEGAPYHPLKAVEAELVSILSSTYSVTVRDRGEALLALGLGGTELVVGYDDRWTEPLDRRHLDAVETWVRAGGRLLLIHNGICWARDGRWRRLAGGRFVGHGPAKDLKFTRQDGESFVLFEEPYRFSVPWFSANRVWATYEDGGRSWPAFWTRTVGKGQITYTLPGHGTEAFRHPDYRRWLAAAANP